MSKVYEGIVRGEMPAGRLRSALTLATAATGVGAGALALVGSSNAARTARHAGSGQIVFVRVAAGPTLSSALWLANPLGGSPRRLTVARPKYGQLQPRWSPDGRRIAYARLHFQSAKSDPDLGELRLVTLGSSASRRLDRAPSRQVDLSPTWSPDGRRIAFVRVNLKCVDTVNACAFSETWLVNTDGSGRRRLAATDIGGAAWSPDGSRVAVVAPPRPPFLWGQLELVEAGSGGVQELPAAVGGSGADWSPDGSSLAYSQPDGRIAVIRLDGSIPAVLTSPPVRVGDLSATWSPDGRRLAFRRVGGASEELYVVNADEGRRGGSPSVRGLAKSWRGHPTGRGLLSQRGGKSRLSTL